MCGRITLTKSKKSIIKDLAIDSWRADGYSPSYNIAPSQFSPILIKEDSLKVIKNMQWGLSSNVVSDYYKPINIRLETLLKKGYYQNLVSNGRCVVLSSGYYEWVNLNGQKIPYYFQFKNRSIIKIAGLWTALKSSQGISYTYAIVTTKAQSEIKHLHHRMPLILDELSADDWVKHEGNKEQNLIANHNRTNETKLHFFTVSNLVNSPRNNTHNCIKPFEYSFQCNMFNDF